MPDYDVQKCNVQEHMEVVGSCGNHLGTVDRVEGDRIKLTKNDPEAEGKHHFIPKNWVVGVDDKVHLSKDCGGAKREWITEGMSV